MSVCSQDDNGHCWGKHIGIGILKKAKYSCFCMHVKSRGWCVRSRGLVCETEGGLERRGLGGVFGGRAARWLAGRVV